MRCWVEERTPLSPFGFGLTYEEVKDCNLRLSSTLIDLDDAPELSGELRTRSLRSIEEIAWLSLHQHRAGVHKSLLARYPAHWERPCCS